MTELYWIAFLGYSTIVVGTGFYIYRREKRKGIFFDNQEYWTARRKLSGISTGLSISASMMSISWSCVYGVQLFYWYGIGGAWLLLIPWLITIVGFYLLTPLFRKMEIFSQPELIGKKFGKQSRMLLAPALIFVFTIWAGAEIFAAGIIISPFLKISLPLTLLLITVIVALYSYSGGFKAVIATDKIQFFLVGMFISIIAFIGVSAIFNGSSQESILGEIPQPPKKDASMPLFLSPGFALIIMTFIVYLPGWLVETDVWLRLQAADTHREARKGVLLAGLNSLLFVGILPAIIGLTALYIYPPVGTTIPDRLQDGALIFSTLMQDYSPVWLNAFLAVGLVAAAMSTIDTCSNVVALSISYDILEPAIQRHLSKEKLNRLARWTSVLAIFLAFIYSLFTESLWDIFYLSSGILTTTVFLPVITSFLPGTRKLQVNLAIIFGFTATILFYFLEKSGGLLHFEPAFLQDTGLGYILWGFLAAVVGWVLGRIKFNEQ